MAALRGTIEGDRQRTNSDAVSHRLADRSLTVRADTWRTFVTVNLAKDGSGDLAIKRDGRIVFAHEWSAE